MEPETDLEKEFQKLYEEHNQEIQDKLAQASKLIDEAVALSEKYGLPFSPDAKIMWCRPGYYPRSFKDKFDDLDSEFVSDLTNAGWPDYPGWQRSQVC